jgi:hypothetical protein
MYFTVVDKFVFFFQKMQRARRTSSDARAVGASPTIGSVTTNKTATTAATKTSTFAVSLVVEFSS